MNLRGWLEAAKPVRDRGWLVNRCPRMAYPANAAPPVHPSLAARSSLGRADGLLPVAVEPPAAARTCRLCCFGGARPACRQPDQAALRGNGRAGVPWPHRAAVGLAALSSRVALFQMMVTITPASTPYSDLASLHSFLVIGSAALPHGLASVGGLGVTRSSAPCEGPDYPAHRGSNAAQRTRMKPAGPPGRLPRR